MSVMILDAGNSIIKAKIARRDRSEISFPHAIRQLTESEYRGILARSNASKSIADYVRINGQPYVIGESAERHGVLTQCNGPARYSKDYYGILAAATLGLLYDRSREVSIFLANIVNLPSQHLGLMQALTDIVDHRISPCIFP